MAQAHILLFVTVAVGCLAAASEAHLKIHIVGGSYGWKIPKNKTFYHEWAQTKEFIEGDKLMFLYTSGLQNVVEVASEEEFAQCQLNNAVNMLYEGPTLVELTTPGPHYYYCGVGLHCEDGQKLSINVSPKAAAAINANAQKEDANAN